MMATREEGGPWRPAHAKECDALAKTWCRHCLNRNGDGDWEDEFGNEIDGRCEIQEASIWGIGVICDHALFDDLPTDLTIRSGIPWCRAFRQDPESPARCLFTKEMFS